MKFAQTIAELDEVGHFRKTIYCKEQNKSYFQFDEALPMIEPEDVCAGSRVLYTHNDQHQLIATCRINIGIYPSFLIKPLKIREIEETSGMSPTVTSRLMLDNNVRGSNLLIKVIREIFEYTTNNQSYIGVFNCNPRLKNLFYRYGFRQYAPLFLHPYAGEQVPMLIIAEPSWLTSYSANFFENCYTENKKLHRWFLDITKEYNK